MPVRFLRFLSRDARLRRAGLLGVAVNSPHPPGDFAEQCVEAAAAWEMVNARFSWEEVSRCFERVMMEGPRLGER